MNFAIFDKDTINRKYSKIQIEEIGNELFHTEKMKVFELIWKEVICRDKHVQF